MEKKLIIFLKKYFQAKCNHYGFVNQHVKFRHEMTNVLVELNTEKSVINSLNSCPGNVKISKIYCFQFTWYFVVILI